MTEHPSIVVGVGEAGTKMAADLYDDLESRSDEEGFLDEFKFIGIDTQSSDLERYKREGFATIDLETPSQFWDTDRGNFYYLTEDMDLDPTGGASRRRGTSRYYIDNKQNFGSLWSQLESQIDSFVEDADGSPNVWILNSYGGGTGSGAYPLLVAILDEITDDGVWIGGIGSLPRLDTLDQDQTVPDDDSDLYANSYTALRELAVLLDLDLDDNPRCDFSQAQTARYRAKGTNYPLRVPVHSEPQILGGDDHLELEDVPFDFYGLMGLWEGESDSYKAEMNRIATNTVLYFAGETGLEDFGRGLPRVSGDRPTLFSLDSSALEVPAEDLETFVEKREALADVRDRLETVNREVNRLRANRDAVNAVLDHTAGESPAADPPLDSEYVHPDPTQELSDPLGTDADIGVDIERAWGKIPAMHATARSRAEAFPTLKFNEGILSDRVESLVDDREQLTQDFDEIDGDDVALYFFHSELASVFRTQADEHAFKQRAADELEEHADTIRNDIGADVGRLEDASPVEQWEEGIEPLYKGKIETVKNRLENTSFFQRTRKEKLTDKRDELTNRYSALQSSYEDYRALEAGLEAARRGAENAETRLTDQRNAINSTLSGKEKRRDDLMDREGHLDSKRATLERRLSKYDERRFMTVPFDDFEEVSSDVVAEAESIGELVDSGAIHPQDVVDATSYLIERLKNEIEDLEEDVIVVEKGEMLGALAGGDNAGIVEGDLDDRVSGGDKVTEQFNQFEQRSFVDLDDPFSIRLVGLFTNIRLENTSEFGTVHEKYVAPEPASEEFMTQADDDRFITNKFAYPEFFAEDERIQEWFGTPPDAAAVEPGED